MCTNNIIAKGYDENISKTDRKVNIKIRSIFEHTRGIMLGKRIKALRKRLDLTQAQFAEKMGVNSRAVYEWENDKAEIKEKSLRAIESAFDVNPDWLRDGEGNMFLSSSLHDVSHNLEDIFLWLKSFSDEEQAWIKVEMKKRFPEYEEWLGAK